MESFLTIQALFNAIGHFSPDDSARYQTIKELFSACERLIAYSESEHMLSSNEEFEDLNEEQLACLLGNFFFAKALSDYYTARERRFEAVQQALEQIDIFVERMLTYRLYSDAYVKMFAKELSPAQERDARRASMLEEEQHRKSARMLFDKLMRGDSSDALEALRSQVQQAKFEALREHKFLTEEMELLEFERNRPEEAKNALAYRASNQTSGKPQIVQMDYKTIELVQKQNKFVPLDMVELMKLEEEKYRYSTALPKDDLHKFIKTSIYYTNQPIDWNETNLQAGGGNPYTDHFGDREYRVVRTDRYQIGQGEPEKEYGWENDHEARERDEEEQPDDYKWREQLEWDDWKDQHPAGQGNKRRMVE